MLLCFLPSINLKFSTWLVTPSLGVFKESTYNYEISETEILSYVDIFAGFEKLTNLSLLWYLDLSHNNLKGSFNALGKFSFPNLSMNFRIYRLYRNGF